MLREHAGCIVNVSSMWGLRGASCEVTYSATKAALIALTRSLAAELAPTHVRVNCVAPGVIKTDMLDALPSEVLPQLAEETPLRRLGRPEDIAAARKEYFTVHIDEKVGPAWNIAWFSDPVMLGQYPADGLVGYEQYLPDGWQEDLKTIHQPLDFYGQNIYQGQWWRRGADGEPEHVRYPAGHPHNALEWPINEDGLYWGPRFLYERYHTPILITENGMDAHDAVSLDGKVHDPNRQDYMHRYLRALGQAVADGVPVLGYFYWSFFDNFEWAHGYQERFGLVYVDYQTQERILKDSAYWYQQVMATNGENL